MSLQVDCEELDSFCFQLFHLLDDLGLLPLSLFAKPNEFEKYPRLLFGSIQRYNDVVAGCREWESRVLREASHRKEQYYPEIEKLRQWMVENSKMFCKKSNMQHLRTSLYARVFNYLYPRRVLVNAYCIKQKGNTDAVDALSVDKALPSSIETEVLKIKETYNDEWDAIVADAKVTLINNPSYYKKILTGEVSIPEPEEVEIKVEDLLEEVSQ